MRARGLALYAVLLVAAVALDQWLKYWVETHLPLQQMVELVPYLALYRTYNTGIAFSLLSSFGDKGLLVVTSAVAVFMAYLAFRTEPRQVLARMGFALIIGGAIGNLIDRAVYGHVVDFILFHTPVWSFAVFNTADVFISLGAVLVVLDEIVAWKRARAG